MRFDFATANKIIFGNGTVTELGPLARGFGKRALLVVGIPENQYQQIAIQLADFGVDIWFYPITKEPTVTIVQEGVDTAKAVDCELIIGVGGGSAIDTGKAIAALMTNKGDLYDYLEVIGQGQKITRQLAKSIDVTQISSYRSCINQIITS
jgi:alcohol dehydrogenase class IV